MAHGGKLRIAMVTPSHRVSAARPGAAAPAGGAPALRFTVSRRSAGVALLLSCVLIAIGLYKIHDPRPGWGRGSVSDGYIMVCVFGGAAVICLVSLIRGGTRYVVDARGIVMKPYGLVRWEDLAGFQVIESRYDWGAVSREDIRLLVNNPRALAARRPVWRRHLPAPDRIRLRLDGLTLDRPAATAAVLARCRAHGLAERPRLTRGPSIWEETDTKR
jgi:hypothetical protein